MAIKVFFRLWRVKGKTFFVNACLSACLNAWKRNAFLQSMINVFEYDPDTTQYKPPSNPKGPQIALCRATLSFTLLMAYALSYHFLICLLHKCVLRYTLPNRCIQSRHNAIYAFFKSEGASNRVVWGHATFYIF